jgi:hypothetical protein
MIQDEFVNFCQVVMCCIGLALGYTTSIKISLNETSLVILDEHYKTSINLSIAMRFSEFIEVFFNLKIFDQIFFYFLVSTSLLGATLSECFPTLFCAAMQCSDGISILHLQSM